VCVLCIHNDPQAISVRTFLKGGHLRGEGSSVYVSCSVRNHFERGQACSCVHRQLGYFPLKCILAERQPGNA
jgi:hypothetical protein